MVEIRLGLFGDRYVSSSGDYCIEYLNLYLGPEQNLFGNSNVIQITTDANGKPNLPSMTAKDNCLAKFLQAAIRDYCTAHIREFRKYI